MKQADRLTKGRERVHEEVAKVAAATATFGESDSGERGGERGGELGGERGRGASRTLAPPGVVGARVEERAHAKQDFLAWARGRGVPAQDAEAEWRAQQETEEQSPWDAAQLVEEKRNTKPGSVPTQTKSAASKVAPTPTQPAEVAGAALRSTPLYYTTSSSGASKAGRGQPSAATSGMVWDGFTSKWILVSEEAQPMAAARGGGGGAWTPPEAEAAARVAEEMGAVAEQAAARVGAERASAEEMVARLEVGSALANDLAAKEMDERAAAEEVAAQARRQAPAPAASPAGKTFPAGLGLRF